MHKQLSFFKDYQHCRFETKVDFKREYEWMTSVHVDETCAQYWPILTVSKNHELSTFAIAHK